MNIIGEIEKEMMKKKVPKFNVGDTVDVHVKVIEGDKERIQIFNGLVIARKGAGLREAFMVRRIVQGEGVERVFPIHSPKITKVVVKRRGQPRRAKLYYLRERKGKSARVKEKLGLVPGAETIVDEVEPKEPQKPKEPKESETPKETKRGKSDKSE